MIKIYRAEPCESDCLCALWNKYAENEIVYKKMSQNRFADLFFGELVSGPTDNGPQDGVRKVCCAARSGGSVVGFAAGCYREGRDFAYITQVLVDRRYRRQGIGGNLLRALENELRCDSGNMAMKMEISFYNPCALEWIIPGTPRHDHPNSPGADLASDGYIWLKNCGYRDFAHQVSYYRRLSDGDEVVMGRYKPKDECLHIGYCDETLHYGMEQLFDALGSEDWRRSVLGNLESKNAAPVLIAWDNSAKDETGKCRVCGFTGPLRVQASGRGYFAGIGVHPDYRSRGLGRALFFGLCMALRDFGAEYMTLFTGEDNKAGLIYESAGFRIVRAWACMRKKDV